MEILRRAIGAGWPLDALTALRPGWPGWPFDLAPCVGRRAAAVRRRKIDVLPQPGSRRLSAVGRERRSAVVAVFDVQVTGLAVRPIRAGNTLGALRPLAADKLLPGVRRRITAVRWITVYVGANVRAGHLIESDCARAVTRIRHMEILRRAIGSRRPLDALATLRPGRTSRPLWPGCAGRAGRPLVSHQLPYRTDARRVARRRRVRGNSNIAPSRVLHRVLPAVGRAAGPLPAPVDRFHSLAVGQENLAVNRHIAGAGRAANRQRAQRRVGV